MKPIAIYSIKKFFHYAVPTNDFLRNDLETVPSSNSENCSYIQSLKRIVCNCFSHFISLISNLNFGKHMK